MNTTYSERKKAPLPAAVFLSALLSVPMLSSCGGGNRDAVAPPANNNATSTNYRNDQPQAKKGLSNGQKVAILAGAAALYYLYQKHKNSQGNGQEGKYYLSKNGRVYFRDAQGGVHWIDAPSQGIQVPESEAQQYRDFQGYNGRTTGRGLNDLAPAQ